MISLVSSSADYGDKYSNELWSRQDIINAFQFSDVIDQVFNRTAIKLVEPRENIREHARRCEYLYLLVVWTTWTTLKSNLSFYLCTYISSDGWERAAAVAALSLTIEFYDLYACCSHDGSNELDDHWYGEQPVCSLFYLFRRCLVSMPREQGVAIKIALGCVFVPIQDRLWNNILPRSH